MTNHRVEIERDQGWFQAKCKCRAQSKLVKHDWEAEDWKVEHLALVERIKVHLGNRNPSLMDQYKWYVQMAEADEVTDYDRRLWEQLRDDLGKRLGIGTTAQWEDEPLPLDVERRTDAHTVRSKDSH